MAAPDSNNDSWESVLVAQRAARVEAATKVWRAVLGVFSAVWLLPTIAALLELTPLFVPLALAATSNGYVALAGFGRHRNLMVALAIFSSVLDLILLAGIAFIVFIGYALSEMDWSGLGGVH